jgi:1-acyl-sn-glycerol-3-phosphate acyltransferase
VIAARRNEGFVAAFGAYVNWLLRRSFRGVWVPERLALPSGGFVAVANHTSWWDGFVPFAMQTRIAPSTPFYVMMSEDQLRRFWFFRWGGAFSIGPGVESARASVAYASRCARGGGVWIFPQGRIAAPAAALTFGSGYVRAALQAGVPVVPFALRYAMLESQRPDALIDAAEPVDPRSPGARRRVRDAIGEMLARTDAAIAAGNALERRRSLIEPARGVDDGVGKVLAPFGRRL